MGVHHARGALANEEIAAILNHERCETPRGCGGSFGKIWKFIHAIVLKRKAMFGNRARVAFGLARSANERAEFHQGLIEVGAGESVLRVP
jgi:hypothetical protein